MAQILLFEKESTALIINALHMAEPGGPHC